MIWDNPPSQETGGVSIPDSHADRMLTGTTFNSRARGRGGKMRLRIAVLLFLTAVLLLPYPTCAQTSNSTHGATIRGTVTTRMDAPCQTQRLRC